jgi:type I restriction enzyme S subunit
MPRAKTRDLFATRIPLPPLGEQKRIVAVLNQKMSAIERARAAAEAQLEAAQALRGAYLREAFSGPEAEKWPRVRVGEITSLVRDGPHVTPTYVPEGVPFLTVRNIVNRTIDLTDVSYISPEDHAVFSKAAEAERGDILYTKDGTLGVPCVVDRDLEFSFFVSVALIKPLKDRVDPYYLALALDSPDVLRQVDHLAAGAGLKHIVLTSIRALEIPLPPLDTQRRVAAELHGKLEIAEQTQKGIQERVDTVGRLPTAYLRQAFNGEL